MSSARLSPDPRRRLPAVEALLAEPDVAALLATHPRSLVLRAVRETIDAAASVDWASLSQECGFYDQAHFINDFKHFSGFTPAKYTEIHTNYQNYIPVG